MKTITTIFSLLLTFQSIVAQDNTQEEEETKKKETFYIIGNNNPISEDSLFDNKTQKKVILDAFNVESKNMLGKFEIPGYDATIQFYIKKGKEGFLTFNQKSNETIRNMIKDESPLPLKDLDLKHIPLSFFKDFKEPEYFKKIPINAKFKSIEIELSEGSIIRC